MVSVLALELQGSDTASILPTVAEFCELTESKRISDRKLTHIKYQDTVRSFNVDELYFLFTTSGYVKKNHFQYNNHLISTWQL